MYARAWRITVGSPADQGLFAILFFVVTALVGVMAVASAQLRAAGWSMLVPVWVIASSVVWLWVPRFLPHGKIGLRALLPGALLASVVLGGAVGTAPLWVAGWMNSDGKYFGAFGVTVALIGYIFIMITLSMVCAVFSPVWADRRRAEKLRQRDEAQPTAPSEGPSGA